MAVIAYCEAALGDGREKHMRPIETLAIASAIVALTGCHAALQQQAEAPATISEEMVWIRTDGQRGTGNPILQRQYEIDIAACPGAAQRSPAAAPCMRQRGYILAPISQAESLLEEFARARG
jgi:hypothetical protein